MLSLIPAERPIGGRPKGAANKINRDIRAMILEALDDVGGPRYLSRQAIENPVAFMGLLGKILPTTLASSDGSPIHLHLLAAKLMSEEILTQQQSPHPAVGPPTINAEPNVPDNLLDAPPPSE
jgi:hypothetical protein